MRFDRTDLFNRIELIYMILSCCPLMQTQASQFTELLNSNNDNTNSILLTREQRTEIVGIYSAPCPNTSAGAQQPFYRIQKKYPVKHTQSCQLLYITAPDSSMLLRVLAKEELSTFFLACTVKVGST